MDIRSRALARSPNPSGWRREDETRARFAQMANSAPIGAHARTAIWTTTKRALRALKVNATQQKLLETLVFRTKECDWEQGARPIVWLSNAALARAAGLCISNSTVRTSLSALASLGLITFRDSANCRRAGDRDQNDRIIYAYGIELSVLEARFDELRQIAEAYEADEAAYMAARAAVQRLRRSIPAHIQSAVLQDLDGRWNVFRARYERIVAHLGRSSSASLALLRRVQRALSTLLDHVQKAMIHCAYAEKTDATALENGCLLETTTQDHSVSCTEKRHCADAQSVDLPPDAGFAGEKRAFENCVGAGTNVEPKSAPQRGQILDLPMVLAACPEFSVWTDDDVQTWPAFVAAAGAVRAALGISPSAWHDARAVMGPAVAAVAVAVIAQKSAAGEIREPGGYLRGMTSRHQAGRLHLDKSVRALLVANEHPGLSSRLAENAARRTMQPYKPAQNWTPRLI